MKDFEEMTKKELDLFNKCYDEGEKDYMDGKFLNKITKTPYEEGTFEYAAFSQGYGRNGN